MPIVRPPYLAYLPSTDEHILFVAWRHLTDWQQGVAANLLNDDPIMSYVHYGFDGMVLAYVILNGELVTVYDRDHQMPRAAVN